MTACKDSLNGKKAVSATLAGVLAVGMVPAAAFADAAQADTTEGQDVELLTPASEVEAVLNGGTATAATVGGDDADISGISIKSADVESSEVVITKAKPAAEDAKAVDIYTTKDGKTTIKEGYSQNYYKAAKRSDDGAVKINGEYWVKVTNWAAITSAGSYMVALGDGNNAVAENAPMVKFTVAAKSLEGAFVAKADTDGDFTITDFAFDFKQTNWNNLAIALDEETAAFYIGDTGTTLYQVGGGAITDTNTYIQAGDYEVVVAPTTGAYAGQKITLKFSVGQCDISTVGFYIDDRAASAGQPQAPDVKIPGTADTLAAKKLLIDNSDFKLTDPATFYNNATGKTTYTLSLKSNASDEAKRNFTGTASITYNRVANPTAVTFKYDKDAKGTFNNNTLSLQYDHSLTADNAGWLKGDFDATKLVGSYVDEEGETQELTSDQVEITMKDDKGNVVTDVTKPGTYVVTVKADAEALGYEYGSATYTINLTVKNGSVAETAGVTFSYKGKVVTSLNSTELTYDGEDYLSRIGIQVKDSKGNVLTAGEDYTVEAKKGQEAVEDITDAGTYTVTVKGNGSYSMTAETLNVKVNKVSLGVLSVDADSLKTYYTASTDSEGEVVYTPNKFLPYTGEAQQLKLKYDTGEKDAEGKAILADVPEDVYTVTKIQYKATRDTTNWTDVDAIDAVGFYNVTIALSKEDVAKNYTGLTGIDGTAKIGTTDVTVEVADKRTFSDVTTSDWFYKEVQQAADNGYVKGIAGTKLYAPNAGMTRGDVCVVLLRMAGGDLDYNQDGSVNTTKGYNTKFSDVDPHVYYAKAIQWASQLGIVTGFDGTTEFGPEQTVSRDQFATMLARYAKATGADIAADASSIDGYADASAVESWAIPYVAWAVEAGVMGQNTDFLMPVKDVSRAEVAAMAVRYQPEATTTDLVK